MLFEKAVFEAQIGHQILQDQCLGTQYFHLAAIILAVAITGKLLLARPQEFLQRALIRTMYDALFAA